MREFFGFLRRLLGGRSSQDARSKPIDTTPTAKMPIIITPTKAQPGCRILQAGLKLRAVESLLLTPTPDSIGEAGVLLEEALALVQLRSKEVKPAREAGAAEVETAEIESPDDLRTKILGFTEHCHRITKLMEGARQIQWARMRWINSYTQTYTSAARTNTWKPTGRTLNIEM